MKPTALIATLTIAFALLSACRENEKDITYSGIATVERTDSTFVLHFYELAIFFPNEHPDSLENGARVKFLCTTTEQPDSAGIIHNANLNEISGDLTQRIVYYDSMKEIQPKYKGEAILIPVDMHITRDYQRNDFFNITTYFTTTNDGNNDDYVCLAHDPSTQLADTTVLWLLHYQNSSDNCNVFTYNTISVPINELKKAGSEWIYIKVLRYGSANDTVATNYTYGYKY
ncbi:MAG: hypothetical protein K6G73_05580 [Marinilabiliaceae bacterium]|nr:hypothetical protein [Marinilabiliaceae bacterium]